MQIKHSACDYIQQNNEFVYIHLYEYNQPNCPERHVLGINYTGSTTLYFSIQ